MKSYRKYRNQRQVVDGIKFDSMKEARRYGELRLLEKTGMITRLVLQPRFQIQIGGVFVKYPSGRIMQYVADFEYMENGKKVIEDVKGMKTDVYKIKQALMLAMGLTIKEV